ncbi:hypothetical protein [Actinomadura sp. 9N407]|uniref:hypothetical protein n=1 Tax=Actinomadura sp. 9N407 TaxID=3375154 RepID=UPI0037BA0BEC
MLGMLRKMGLSSNLMYGMGIASIGASVASWMISRNAEPAGLERADHWGIFVGQWAPTFFALGCAMRMEEQWGSRGMHEQMQESRERAREAMPVSG